MLKLIESIVHGSKTLIHLFYYKDGNYAEYPVLQCYVAIGIDEEFHNTLNFYEDHLKSIFYYLDIILNCIS